MRPSVRLIPAYSTKKFRAIQLRKKGQSYAEIASILRISKSTAYDWTRRIKLSKKAEERIKRKIKEALRKGLAAYNRIYGKIRSQEAAKIREGYKEKASKEIKKLVKRDLKLIGAALYWAEGNLKNRNSLRFGNSNSLMIKTIMKFFREACNIPSEKIKARIHLYPQINQKEATNYWMKITILPRVNFQPPQIQVSRASKGRRPRNTLPYGTLHLTVNNTELACRVKGWIQGVSEKI